MFYSNTIANTIKSYFWKFQNIWNIFLKSLFDYSTLCYYEDSQLQEIEEKAPLIRKQREDYEQSLETIEQMNKQLDAALLESQKMRIEADQANRNYNYMKRENEKLQQETEDLSKQVRGKKGG